jgi:hypothetical protein
MKEMTFTINLNTPFIDRLLKATMMAPPRPS